MNFARFALIVDVMLKTDVPMEADDWPSLLVTIAPDP
jgi:hypothetical protein